MAEPELPYHAMSLPTLEDLMLDASPEQEKLIVQELVDRGATTKTCLKCGKAIGHGLWCDTHMFLCIASVYKR